jgi:hypothetical protein
MTSQLLHTRGELEATLPLLQAWVGRQFDLPEFQVEQETAGWTTLAVDLDYCETDEWRLLGKDLDFFYESYSTSLRMGEIVFCKAGQLIRHLLLDAQNPTEILDIGRLRSEQANPLTTWSDVWGFVDDRSWMKDI